MGEGVCKPLYQLSCRWCHKPFHICPEHLRWHAYCSPECRAAGYARVKREARKRHRESPEGREDHRDAEKERRRKKRARVADQSGGCETSCGKSVPAAPVAAMMADAGSAGREQEDAQEGKLVKLAAPVRCIVCGRESVWVVPWHSRRYVRQQRRNRMRV